MARAALGIEVAACNGHPQFPTIERGGCYTEKEEEMVGSQKQKIGSILSLLSLLLKWIE